MAARKKKTTVRKRAVKKKATRKVTKRKPAKKAFKKKNNWAKANADSVKAREYNRKALWKAYKQIQMRAEKAWEKFRDDVRRKAPSDILIRDHNQLLLLVGECNYMARECMRISNQNNKWR